MSKVRNVPRLRFPGFEREWQKKKVLDVAPLQRGFDLPVDNIEVGNYPVVFSNGILKKHIEFKAIAPGVVTGRSGTIGKVTYVTENYWPHNTSLWVTDFKSNHPKYIYYFYYNFNLAQFGTGSGVPTLNRNDVHNQDVYIPEFSEQVKIAEVLTITDEKLSLLKNKKALLEKYKKGMMQKIFNQEIRFKDEDGKDFQDWEQKKLADFPEMIHGDGDWILSDDLSKEGQYKLIQLGNIGFGRYVEKDLKTISATKFKEINGTSLQNGDLLINRMVDSNLYCCILDKDGDYITSVDVCWIRKNHFFNNYFLMSMILFGSNQIKLLNLSSGSGRVRISKANMFNKFEFRLPSLKEQTKIANFLSAVDDKINLVAVQIEKMEKFKKGLLGEMFV